MSSIQRFCAVALAAASAFGLVTKAAQAAPRGLDNAEKRLVEAAVRPSLSDPKAQLTWLTWNGGATVCGKVGFEYFSVPVTAKAGKVAAAGKAAVFRPGLGPITQARVAACEAATR